MYFDIEEAPLQLMFLCCYDSNNNMLKLLLQQLYFFFKQKTKDAQDNIIAVYSLFTCVPEEVPSSKNIPIYFSEYFDLHSFVY